MSTVWWGWKTSVLHTPLELIKVNDFSFVVVNILDLIGCSRVSSALGTALSKGGETSLPFPLALLGCATTLNLQVCVGLHVFPYNTIPSDVLACHLHSAALCVRIGECFL